MDGTPSRAPDGFGVDYCAGEAAAVRGGGMMKTILALTIALCVASCDVPKNQKQEVDQAKRHTYFLECLAALPAGPQSTKYNDWDEVVDSCNRTAYQMAAYCYANCPPSADDVARENGRKK